MQQLWLAALSCLTYKLFALHSRMGALQREVEVRKIVRSYRLTITERASQIAMDQHQLAVIRSTIAATLPATATSTRHLMS
jgi:hypothetical protein